jgi:hypothetical protein
MGLGLALALLRPVWLAPPMIALTPIVYLVLLTTWLPALVVCAVFRPIGGRRVPILLATLGLLMTLAWSMLIGPSAGMSLLVTSRMACQRELISPGQVRYTCIASFPYYNDTYVLEGPDGSPFLRLVRARSGSS